MNEKLQQLATDYGFASTFDMLESAMFDSVCPAICTSEDCNYTCDMEPDQRNGYCEACGNNSVVSCLVLAGII